MHVLLSSSSDITDALRLALETNPHIYIPPGDWTCGEITLPSGCLIEGAGAATKITRTERWVLSASCTCGVSIRSLAIDIAADENFRTAIKADEADDLLIRDLRLRNSGIREDGHTYHGLSVRGCQDVRVFGVHAEGCQLKVGGPTDSRRDQRRILVLGCQVLDGHNFGISCVTDGVQHMSDVLIANCQLHHCWSGGIYVGSDGDPDVGGTLERVTVRGCTISTNRAGMGRGILARVERGHTLRLVDNDCVALHPPNNVAVFVKRTDAGQDQGWFTGVALSGNTAVGFNEVERILD